MSLGGWVSEEDVTISKQTFRAVLYLLRRPGGQKFRNMVIGHAIFFLETFPKMLIIWSLSLCEIATSMYVCLLPISQHHTDIIDWETCDI